MSRPVVTLIELLLRHVANSVAFTFDVVISDCKNGQLHWEYLGAGGYEDTSVRILILM